jgi:hypothetical protein
MVPSGRTGVGASGEITGDCLEEAVLVLSDDAVLYVFEITLTVAPMTEELLGIPSLLGRDILDRCRMIYSPTEPFLSVDVRQCDTVIPIQPGYTVRPWRQFD